MLCCVVLMLFCGLAGLIGNIFGTYRYLIAIDKIAICIIAHTIAHTISLLHSMRLDQLLLYYSDYYG